MRRRDAVIPASCSVDSITAMCKSIEYWVQYYQREIEARMATMTAVVDDADSALVEQLVDAELGNSAYVLVDRESGFAGVIDPPRDADRFLDLARGAGWRITT